MPTRRNPNAGTATDLHSAVASGCALSTTEALPGTAKQARLVLALEYFTNWGRDILDGEALGKELAGKLKKFLKENGAALHFIRKPGREGQERQERAGRALYIAWADCGGDATAGSAAAGHAPVLEYLDVAGPEDILDLDLSAPGANAQARRITEPLLLVCTHGKRDTCCAVFGRPLAEALHREYPEVVWEASHTKGHRFAPSMILLPTNYSYGRLTEDEGLAMIAAARRGELALTGNRGRGTLDVPGQVAELAAAGELQGSGKLVPWTGLDVSRPGEGREKEKASAQRFVTDPVSGEAFHVQLVKDNVGVAISSCGDKPKQAVNWFAVSVERTSSPPEGVKGGVR
ncbi:MAG TPA: sucrase ferredoxin [Candidatus Corynebacterium gallistercoris]|uniref:Sucrase ferredoxin n=1 Tax=Candidatus Corynebacterium gallistercoris TaxID=2838530 RepID=A0A9D1RVK0_9CORY|nr:sucrase ferredoxin [Candidatus Corynebacterium gallistercoris]